MKLETIVKFYETYFDPGEKLTYSVISARYQGKWIFVRHHQRSTFEIPGGHIEEGETPDEAASRELMEETGALQFSIQCVATYSVLKDGHTGWGRLYFSEVSEVGPVPDTSEIAEVMFSDQFTGHNTHPDIQPHLFRKTIEFMKEKKI